MVVDGNHILELKWFPTNRWTILSTAAAITALFSHCNLQETHWINILPCLPFHTVRGLLAHGIKLTLSYRIWFKSFCVKSKRKSCIHEINMLLNQSEKYSFSRQLSPIQNVWGLCGCERGDNAVPAHTYWWELFSDIFKINICWIGTVKRQKGNRRVYQQQLRLCGHVACAHLSLLYFWGVLALNSIEGIQRAHFQSQGWAWWRGEQKPNSIS